MQETFRLVFPRQRWLRLVSWIAVFTMFIALNLADLQLTRQLLEYEGKWASELNPLAQQLLARHGWQAVTWFKLTTTSAVTIIFGVVSAFRPNLGRWIAFGSCAVLAAVVGYNLALNYFPQIASPHSAALLREARETEVLRDQQLRDHIQLSRQIDALAHLVNWRHCSFTSALAEGIRWCQQHPALLDHLPTAYPDCSKNERLALYIMARILQHGVRQGQEVKQLAHELAESYASCFGRPVPELWWTIEREVRQRVRVRSQKTARHPSLRLNPPFCNTSPSSVSLNVVYPSSE